MITYRGRCHCGAVRFEVDSEPIASGIRCNCSLCIRKGAVMSEAYFPPAQFRLAETDALGCYRWGDHDVNHWFCKRCGIYPFHDVVGREGHRVNLGCLDELDVMALPIRIIDGRAL